MQDVDATANNAQNNLFANALKFLPVGHIKIRLKKIYMTIRHPGWHAECILPVFTTGSIFLDLDASWHNGLKRSSLLPALKKCGVKVATLHYDIIPLLHPDMIPDISLSLFVDHLSAHLRYSDLFICISKNSEVDLREYADRSDPNLDIKSTTITLGSDISVEGKVHPDQIGRLSSMHGKYILIVGTIEPRKNHQALLDAYDRLSDRYPELNLIIVGRKGWHADHTINRIRQHKLFGKSLFWLRGLSDKELSAIYKRAYIAVVPSFYEGYGLPISEALCRGCVVVASNRGALMEAGGDFAEYFDPSSSEALLTCLLKYIENDELYLAKKAQLKEYSPPLWRDTIEQLLEALSSIA